LNTTYPRRDWIQSDRRLLRKATAIYDRLQRLENSIGRAGISPGTPWVGEVRREAAAWITSAAYAAMYPSTKDTLRAVAESLGSSLPLSPVGRQTGQAEGQAERQI